MAGRIRISKQYASITNHGTLNRGAQYNILLWFGYEQGITNCVGYGTAGSNCDVGTFNNYGKIILNDPPEQAINFSSSYAKITTLNNYGEWKGVIQLGDGGTNNNGDKIGTINNYGTMMFYVIGYRDNNDTSIGTLNNYGSMPLHDFPAQGLHGYYHITTQVTSATIGIGTYNFRITQNAATFNAFSGSYAKANNDTSHLAIGSAAYGSGGKPYVDNRVYLHRDAKLLLNIGSGFELNKNYEIQKLIAYDRNGTITYGIRYEDNTQLTPEQLFSHFVSTDPLLAITRNGDYFRVALDFGKTVGKPLQTSNLRTLSDLRLQSKTALFKRSSLNKARFTKLGTVAALGVNLSPRFSDYSTFYYDQDREETRQNRLNRGYGRMQPNTNAAESTVRRGFSTQSTKRSTGANAATKASPRNIYAFLSPFVRHAKNNDTNAMGYGFVGGFSGNLGRFNTIGAHLGFNYNNETSAGVLNQLSTNTLMFGGHYRLDTALGLYFKAIASGFYLANNMRYEGASGAAKNSQLGFVGDLYAGWDFSLPSAGALNLEAGFSFQSLKADEMIIKKDYGASENYAAQMLNAAFLDMAVGYEKMLGGGFGFSAGLGGKVLLNEPSYELKYLDISQKLPLKLDKITAYGEASLGYFGGNFDIELRYLGSFGATTKSLMNSGFVDVRAYW